MMPVVGGTFNMGAQSADENAANYDTEADGNESPVHQVALSSYHMGETEVTQALWNAVMGSNFSNFKGDNLPVEQVSWNDCQTFIEKLNQLTGKQFRLPTEAEWEYAARGGNKSYGYKYSGSNTIGDVAWYEDNSENKTQPVAGKAANELGIYDMSGNVFEWCSDWYGTYPSDPQSNPKGADDGSNRVYRGSSWISYTRDCRVSNRGSNTPDYSLNFLGLRLVL